MVRTLFTALTMIILSATACEKKADNLNHPTIENRIFDRADLLTPTDEARIFATIDSLETNVGSQIGVLTVDTLNGSSIEKFSIETANELGLGRKEFNDGVLFTISLKDHKMRVEVGLGLEKIIRSEVEATAIRDQMVAEFKNQNYGSGILLGVQETKKLIEKNKERIGK